MRESILRREKRGRERALTCRSLAGTAATLGVRFNDILSFSYPSTESSPAGRTIKDSPASLGVSTYPMCPSQSLLTSVYNQCWPSPSFLKAVSGQQWKPYEGPRPNKEWIRERLINEVNDDISRRPQTAPPTDRQTLHWKNQSPRQQVQQNTISGNEVTNNNIEPTEAYRDILGDKIYLYSSLYKLTALEFKRLTQQVREASAVAEHRFKGLNFKTQSSASGDRQSAIYRSQLASSLKTFQDKKRLPYYPRGVWSPQESVPGEDPSRTASRSHSALPPRSRPASCRSDRLKRHVPVRVLSASSQRPRSSPADNRSLRGQASGSQPTSASDPQYDTLTPHLLYELNEGQQPESVYGEKLSPSLPEEDEEDDKDKEEEDIQDSTEQVEDEDDSDEDYPEPQVEDIKDKQAPELFLRPEKFDAFDVPIIPKGDRRKYDFDASSVEIPPYEFSPTLSDEMQSMDLRDLAKQEKHWKIFTKKRPEDDVEDQIMDRLIQLERLQMKTEEWEKERRERARLQRQRLYARTRMGARITSAKTWREKRCFPDCTQVACVGDCPSKKEALENSASCLICLDKNCTGNCVESSYENRKRQERVEVEEKPPKSRSRQRPKSCNSCQKTNNAKLINANIIVLGRPKSGLATFSRGQGSSRPKDLRPGPDVHVGSEIERDFDRLGMEPHPPQPSEGEEAGEEERPDTACSNKSAGFGRLKGRSGAVPGKSYFSQRRLSLTDQTGRERVQKTKKRLKSGRKKRPKTAV